MISETCPHKSVLATFLKLWIFIRFWNKTKKKTSPLCVCVDNDDHHWYINWSIVRSNQSCWSIDMINNMIDWLINRLNSMKKKQFWSNSMKEFFFTDKQTNKKKVSPKQSQLLWPVISVYFFLQFPSLSMTINKKNWILGFFLNEWMIECKEIRSQLIWIITFH